LKRSEDPWPEPAAKIEKEEPKRSMPIDEKQSVQKLKKGEGRKPTRPKTKLKKTGPRNKSAPAKGLKGEESFLLGNCPLHKRVDSHKKRKDARGGNKKWTIFKCRRSAHLSEPQGGPRDVRDEDR